MPLGQERDFDLFRIVSQNRKQCYEKIGILYMFCCTKKELWEIFFWLISIVTKIVSIEKKQRVALKNKLSYMFNMKNIIYSSNLDIKMPYHNLKKKIFFRCS